MYDFHIHSEHSLNSKESMENIVHTAIHRDFKCICFTEFIRPESFKNDGNLLYKKNRYFDNIKQVKYKFNNFINILAGIEIELNPNLSNIYDDFINSNPFDFVILSFKNTHRNLITKKNKYEPIELIRNYYDYIYETLKLFDNFDVLGHFDYIDRFFVEDSNQIKFKDYSEQVDRILKLLINNGKGLEVNTSAQRLGLDYFFPKVEILKRYKKLGGEIVTIGSDSKDISELGYKYDEAMELLKEIGFNKVHIFESRDGLPIKI